MLHHVAMEVRQGDVEGDRRFWTAVGFVAVPVPPALGRGYTWFERAGSQIHLLHRDDPVIPPRGHVAVVAPDFEESLERVRAAGIELEERSRLWGARRAKAILPSGHTVELMAAPPEPSNGVE